MRSHVIVDVVMRAPALAAKQPFRGPDGLIQEVSHGSFELVGRRRPHDGGSRGFERPGFVDDRVECAGAVDDDLGAMPKDLRGNVRILEYLEQRAVDRDQVRVIAPGEQDLDDLNVGERCVVDESDPRWADLVDPGQIC